MSDTVECPECCGTGKHRAILGYGCPTCHGKCVISESLSETLFNLALEDRARRKRLPANVTVATTEILGHQTDFLISQKREGDRVVVTVETVMPAMKFENGLLKTWAPPRYPWKQMQP